jgi:RNA polymerase sigma-70 factor (ECF subfamily)
MRDDAWLAAEFEASRPRLHAVAYRMLGSHPDADDAVQEAWLRLAGKDHDRIENVGGLLTTVVGRVCLDRLRARRARPEDAVEGVTDAAPTEEDDDPAQHAELAESVGSALLVVLDSLGPAERVAFVLHDVFAVPFDEVGEILERSPESARQLASRARRRLQGTTVSATDDRSRRRAVVDAFLRAARTGDFDALMRLLDPDVVLVPDTAATGMGSLREMHGAADVATALSGGARGARLATIDGLTGFVWMPAGELRGVVEFTIAGDRIVAIRVTGDQERLRTLDIALVDEPGADPEARTVRGDS